MTDTPNRTRQPDRSGAALELAGALLDVLAVCHKNRQAETIRRLEVAVRLATELPAGVTAAALAWVADRAGVELETQTPDPLEAFAQEIDA